MQSSNDLFSFMKRYWSAVKNEREERIEVNGILEQRLKKRKAMAKQVPRQDLIL